MEPNFVGKVCCCSTGRVGLVVRQKIITFPSGETKQMWEGIGLDGKGLWCTSNPIEIHPSIEAYMDRLVLALKQPGCVYPPLGSGALNPLGA